MPAVESLPTKPKSQKAPQHEIDAFVEKYELYADIYGDPVEVAFRVMAYNTSNAENADQEIALRAADMLMSYRYPRIKAVQGQQGPNGPQFTFNIDLTGRAPEIAAPVYEIPRIAGPVETSYVGESELRVEPVVDLSGILE